MNRFLQILAAIVLVLLGIFLTLLIVRSVGIKVDVKAGAKHNMCIQRNTKQIEGCVFWMRNNDLAEKQGWKNADMETVDKKRKENWDYLVSKEKDGFYEWCVSQQCGQY